MSDEAPPLSQDKFRPDGRQYRWSASSLDDLICLRLYYYRQIRQLRSHKKKDDLIFGAVYAAAIERYHKVLAEGGNAEVEAVRCAMQATWFDGASWESEKSTKTRETLVRSLVWYFEQYKNDPCETIILTDGTPAVEKTFRFKVADDIDLYGRLDRLISYAGEPYIQDQKTTGSTIGPYYFKQFNVNNQMSLIALAAKTVYATPIKGVMIDAAQVAVGFTRFERGFTFRTDDQLIEWLNSITYHIKFSWDGARYEWPMNQAACGMYGGCEFRDICAASPHIREAKLKTDFEVVPRD